MAAAAGEDVLRSVLAAMAPGTQLRDGLERILRGNTGGLIVLGHDRTVESLSTGGFELDVEFSATRLRELSKMDGAVVLSTDGTQHPAGERPSGARSDDRHRRAGHPPPHGRAGRQADRLSGDFGEPVDADHRAVRAGPALRAGRFRRHPLAGQPGARHARALQAAPRRGRRHAFGAGDRRPGHRPRCGRRLAAAGDGAAHLRGDRRLRRRARHRRPAAFACSSRS